MAAPADRLGWPPAATMSLTQQSLELLSTAEMYRADKSAMERGVSGLELMERAGQGVADALLDRFGPRDTAVLCGPGNNGGDGFVVARLLRQAGANVTLALLGDRARLKGDAAAMAERWDGPVAPLSPACLEGSALVVDALFGAGLARNIADAALATLQAAEARGLPLVSIDTPSGVHGDSGQIMGFAPHADLTVSFFRAKPGHFLAPGRWHCGELRIVDIGIPEAVLSDIAPQCRRNLPGLWLSAYPWPRPEGHKYRRGHAVVLSGPKGKTGAARLAARGALRSGAGLVTLACRPTALAENAAQLTAVMLDTWRDTEEFEKVIGDSRRNAVLLGPGSGVNATTRANVLAALRLGKAVVLDADAITCFAGQVDELSSEVTGACIMTPHEAEFARLFDVTGDKLSRARSAARQSGVTILLKGPDTVIAAPDGRAAICDNAPPTLATAGSGDVLAGFCLGLLTQGVPAFEAAAAAAWLHGEAANSFGPGLIAEDLPEALPGVLRELQGLAAMAGRTNS